MTWQDLLDRLGRDRLIVESLIEAGLFSAPVERQYSDEEVEIARVARILMRELDVNMPGVEVILHMRRQMSAIQRQVAELIELVKTHRGG
jgi:MerR family transcriptional regulator/heat shock protein HspR